MVKRIRARRRQAKATIQRRQFPLALVNWLELWSVISERCVAVRSSQQKTVAKTQASSGEVAERRASLRRVQRPRHAARREKIGLLRGGAV